MNGPGSPPERANRGGQHARASSLLKGLPGAASASQARKRAKSRGVATAGKPAAPQPLRLLILDDSDENAELAVDALEESGCGCIWDRVADREAFLQQLDESTYDLILADYSLPALDGMTALRLLCERQVDLPFIIVSGAQGEERAIEAVKAGATDYVLKSRLARLAVVVQRALSEREEQSERRQAEDALRRSEERFRVVAEVTFDAVWDWDLITDEFERNESMQAFFGYTAEQIRPTAQWWMDHIHPDDVERVATGIYSLINGGGRRWTAEYRFRRGDGSYAHVFDRGQVIQDAAGTPLRMIGAMMDVTARRQAEEKILGLNESLREEAEVAGAVARAGEELIEGLDSEGLGRTGLLARVCRVTTAVLECDVSWTLLLNRERTYFAPVAVAGASPDRLEEVAQLHFPARTIDPWLAMLRRNEVLQVAAPPGSGPADALALRLGCDVVLHVPLRRGGDVIGVLTAGRRPGGQPFAPAQERIARRLGHLASLSLEAAQLFENLAEANRLKADFVATMSHELRTPLNIVLGYGDLLREHAYGPLNGEQERILGVMDQSSRQLLALIEATLDLSRLERGRLPRVVTDVEPRELLSQMRAEARHLEGSKVRIVWPSSRSRARIRTDAAKLKLIVRHLVENAVKFTPEGEVRVGTRRRRRGLELEVTDTGIGIPAGALPIIFDPFRQAERASTRHYGGVGLGLYLVRRLVDLLEGSIAVESEVGRGSTFRVWLPDLQELESTAPLSIEL